MNRKSAAAVLAGVGVLLVFVSFILLCISADFVGDIENALEDVFMEARGYHPDIDLDGGTVRKGIELLEEFAEDDDLPEMLRMIGVRRGGFRLFALKARGWCFGAGIVSALAAAVMMAFEVNRRIAEMTVELAREYRDALAAGFRLMISGIEFKIPEFAVKKPEIKVNKRKCSACGAEVKAGSMYCSSCGKPLE